jgi:hypothetical protein
MNITDMTARIDVVADAVRAKLVGDPVRAFEYQAAEIGAKAYKATGYTGAVPPVVQCWADTKGWTAQAACDDILTEAAQYHGALEYLRSTRLQGKYALVGLSQDAAEASFAATINALKVLG